MPQLEVDGKVMHPLIWNLTRFHPFWALMEMTMGTSNVAFYFRRDVMCFLPTAGKSGRIPNTFCEDVHQKIGAEWC